MVTENEKKLYAALDGLNIEYTRYEHDAVYTIEEIKEKNLVFDGAGCKNLFLRNRKGDIHYLVVVEESKTVDLKKLSKDIGSTPLSFGSEERLYNNLGLMRGSVTPMGLINNTDKKVKLIIDSDLAKSQKIAVHPNVNTATIVLSLKDLEKFVHWCGNEFSYIKI
ncbi:prolyl-tRNA synthetase [Clostridium carboxidivorans P7]|nr:prolyl-tRNA synthetase associated domain-containing protein [Clostridium carboxidivorans]AKN30940.1 prolyl-tRNA synthetase [Clostridium carboxidivorans P7]EFG88805.1 YbaK/prolyl-tRNA synthetase-associated domain protein [Clostridium carboxidivorans P7]